MKARRYCWRAGIGIELAADEKCPECGSADHLIIGNGRCGNFVQVSSGGKPCQRDPDHIGECSLDHKPSDVELLALVFVTPWDVG